MDNMNNLNKIEKRIIDYLVSTNSMHDDIESFQQNPSNIKDLIFYLFHDDKLLRDAGLLIDFSSQLNEVKAYLMENNNNGKTVIQSNWLVLQRLVFLLTKMISFITQLEADGYIERIDNIYNPVNQNKEIHVPDIPMEGYSKTLEINNKELLTDLIDCLGYYYVSTEKLINFKTNNYRTEEAIISSNEIIISNQNIRIAKFGLYTSIFSTFISLIAILLTIYNAMKTSSIKIDEKQFNAIKEFLKMEKKLPIKDSIGQFR